MYEYSYVDYTISIIHINKVKKSGKKRLTLLGKNYFTSSDNNELKLFPTKIYFQSFTWINIWTWITQYHILHDLILVWLVPLNRNINMACFGDETSTYVYRENIHCHRVPKKNAIWKLYVCLYLFTHKKNIKIKQTLQYVGIIKRKKYNYKVNVLWFPARYISSIKKL